MKIGHKIRQLRELKGLSQEDMANELKMSLNGYGRIERNEVDVNVERLEEISKILEVNPEVILTFDEKFVFNVSGKPHNVGQKITYNSLQKRSVSCTRKRSG